MVDVFDVAKYILEQLGEITAIKLQKLVYYSQAWSLVWDEKRIFSEEIEAWANGPVVPELYNVHRRAFSVNANDVPGDSSKLDKIELNTINAVLKFYGDKSSLWLSNLTHNERPWIEAREGLKPGERSNREIPISSIAEYYGSL